MHSFSDSMTRKATMWLRQGISPPQLAFTLALGFAIGCIPFVGISTAICAALALALGLNMPAIQAANYAVMPLQLVLILPFVRLGGWMFHAGANQGIRANALLHGSPMSLLTQWSGLAAHAILAWLLIAGPAVALMTATLTPLLRRVPMLATSEK